MDKTAERPVIYQLLPRLFTNYNDKLTVNGSIEQNGAGKLNDITPRILGSIKELGVTHVWYTGVIEHAHDCDYTRYGIKRHNRHVVKGKAGSPYAITDYYDIDPDIAVDVSKRMSEFEALVERTHQAGMKVIIDFVPNHVSREYHSDACPSGVKDLGCGDDTNMFFSPNNNFYYITGQAFAPHVDLGEGADRYEEYPAKATGNDCFSASPGECDWYETVKLNYGVDPWNGSKHFEPTPDTWHKMLDILLFWAGKGVDAFRCDMVHMVPVEFWHWAIGEVKSKYPTLQFIAEIYDINLYRSYIGYGGFDYLYDKVTLYDTLRGVQCHDWWASQLTGCWQTVEGISHNMLNFLENHDEQRYASPQFAGDAHSVLPSLVASATINCGAMMIYMGQELGEPALDAEGYSGKDGRTTIFDFWSLDTLRRWLNNGNCGLRRLSKAERELRKSYAKVLSLVNSSSAVRSGKFFDLMYVNNDNTKFDTHREYAYLRCDDEELLLIVVNFANHEIVTEINIPQHAFDYLHITQGLYDTIDMLSEETAKIMLNWSTPVTLKMSANGAAIVRFNLSQLAKKANKC
jgi:glycosidase